MCVMVFAQYMQALRFPTNFSLPSFDFQSCFLTTGPGMMYLIHSLLKDPGEIRKCLRKFSGPLL